MTAFFIETDYEDWFSVGIPVYHCVYAKDAYSDELYTQYGIPFSPTLDRAVPKRRAEFLAGRYCAEKALGQLGCVEKTVGIGTNRNPSWPAGMIGSISHTHSLAAAWVVRADHYTGIGIDVEHIVDDATANRLHKNVLTEREFSRLSYTTGRAALAFTIAFSVKESFFKATYASVGRYFDFSAVSVDDLDFEAGTINLTVAEPLCAGLYVGRQLSGKFRMLDGNAVATAVTYSQH